MKYKFGKYIDRLTEGASFDFLTDDDGREAGYKEMHTVINAILRNLKFICFVVILSLIYISNRMMCEKQYTRIDKLNKDLTTVKYVSMITEAELLDLSRPDKIHKLMEQNGLQLQEQDCPPYKVTFKGK